MIKNKIAILAKTKRIVRTLETLTENAQTKNTLARTLAAFLKIGNFQISHQMQQRLLIFSPNRVCDGQSDCKRGEDETDCDIKCDLGQFSCPSKMVSARERRQNYCVSQKHICDGHKDCMQGEDEENCPALRTCEANTKCQQLCITTSTGKDECSCKVGYILGADRFSCDDINECEFSKNPCSQTCNNTIGGFM